ncbi:MAG: adenosylcobinamide-GDP ribazoletransferase [Anaerolineales bacterium]
MPRASWLGRARGIASAQLLGLAAAMQFLTVLPPVVRRTFSPREMGAAVGLFPLPGLLIGLIVAGAWLGLYSLVGPLLAAALALAIWVVLTGALHLDGLLDSCDGLLGGHTPERRLEIMRDHHIGAFALAGGVLLLMLKGAALAELPASDWRLLALAPVVARGGLSLAVVTQPYARPQGTGATLKAESGPVQAVLAAALTVLISLALGNDVGLAIAGGTLLVQAAVVAFVRHKIPGLTGDSYGALVELGELAAVLCIAVV